MALVRTTLTSAVALGDTHISVASATSIAPGRIIRIDSEWFVVQKDYSSGTSIPVRGGQFGSARRAHVVTAGVVHGEAAADFDPPGIGVSVSSPTAGRGRQITSITADNSTVTHTPAGTDHVVVLNGTTIINLTVPVPTVDMDGDRLLIGGNGKAAHIVTFTGGLGAVGGTADIVTFSATQAQAFEVIALNAVWNLISVSTATANVSGPTVT